MSIDLSPEIERGLTVLASQRGLSVNDYLKSLLAKEARFLPSQPTGEETADAFIAWADSFPDTPVLSDEAMSRASMYPDRW